ncbi:hypothetical protein FYA02_00965 [Escherichia coli O80:H26]|nr:hypothetical protein FYA02_00965 [Escherichia coli O80:H26]
MVRAVADFADITTGGRRTIEPWPPEQIRAKITTTIESSQTNRSTFLYTTYCDFFTIYPCTGELWAL